MWMRTLSLLSRQRVYRAARIAPLRVDTFTHTRNMSSSMKAILIKDGKGSADALYIGEEAKPQPAEGEVLVKIKAFGLNRMDLLQREGKYPLPPQASKTIMGVEFSGVVEQVGNNAETYKPGDEVFGLAFGGAYAQYITSPTQMLLPKPKELSWVQAAALPENWMTAYQALFLEGGLKKGQNVLIHAGASGVGVAAIQLALHVGGAAKVFTTCGTDDKVRFLQKLGGEKVHVVNYKTQDFEKEIQSAGQGIDLIIDFIGPKYFDQNLSVLNKDGTMVLLAFMSGIKLEGNNLGPLLFKRLTIKGSTLRSRSTEYQQDLLQHFKNDALDKIVNGEMKIEVHEVFPWDKVADAHKEMEANKNSGKIVFEVTGA